MLVIVKCIRIRRASRTVRVGESNGKGNSLGLALANISGSVPHPAAVRADVGGQGDFGDNCAQTCVSKAMNKLGGTSGETTYCSGWRRP